VEDLGDVDLTARDEKEGMEKKKGIRSRGSGKKNASTEKKRDEPGGGEDSHQLLEGLERSSKGELDVHGGHLREVGRKGSVMVRVVPLPRGSLPGGAVGEARTKVRLSATKTGWRADTYTLIVVVQHPREPLDVVGSEPGRKRRSQPVKEARGGGATGTRTHCRRKALSESSTPNFSR
jgi:hypothetical protein